MVKESVPVKNDLFDVLFNRSLCDQLSKFTCSIRIAGFADIQSTFSSLVTPDVLNTLDESTNYFQLKVVVRIDTVRVTLYSVLQRGSQGSVAPILRSLGTT